MGWIWILNQNGTPTRLQKRDEQSSNSKIVFLIFYQVSVFTGGENILWSWYSRAFQAHFFSWYHWSQNESCLLCVLGFAFLWMKVITDANIYLLKIKNGGGKKKIEMNACGALAAVSVRVLGCYLGLKYIQGGTQGSCSRAGGGGGNSAKRNSGADKCLKRWQNVICWHLPTEGPRCFKHDGAAFTTSDSCQREGEKWLNTVFSKGHRPLFQRPAGAAREARIIQLFLPTESHL